MLLLLKVLKRLLPVLVLVGETVCAVCRCGVLTGAVIQRQLHLATEQEQVSERASVPSVIM